MVQHDVGIMDVVICTYSDAPTGTRCQSRIWSGGNDLDYFSLKPSTDGCVSAAVTELIFPSTQVGTVSSLKIPLQNGSCTKREVGYCFLLFSFDYSIDDDNLIR